MAAKKWQQKAAGEEGRPSMQLVVDGCRAAGGSQPCPTAVPVPVALLSTEAKVLHFTITCNPDLQDILQTVAATLLNTTGVTVNAAEVGKILPQRAHDWMQRHDLRLCRLLACYPFDFDVQYNGRRRCVQYLHGSAIAWYTFVSSEGQVWL
eukprot:TRINITY_DN27905_c0_g2_i1.p1 TRINITY_DN27905_c0_g2~~TRINITY_DN27905_c0_g2_i1.p1  ORF type:complete len:151 (+),score=13.48 TRINITY_DN27905_c0_g2_i1:251-703(+)